MLFKFSCERCRGRTCYSEVLRIEMKKELKGSDHLGVVPLIPLKKTVRAVTAETVETNNIYVEVPQYIKGTTPTMVSLAGTALHGLTPEDLS